MKRRGLIGLALLAAVLLLVVPSAAGFYTDWLWFRELGYEHVFLRSLNAQAIVFVAAFLAVFLFLLFNFRVARRALGRPHLVLGTSASGRPITIEARGLTRIATPVSVVVALLLAFSTANDWLSWLSFFNAVPFGRTDPILGRDVAFYVFRLPVLEAVRGQALLVCVLALIGCGLLYVLSGSFVLEPRFGVAFWPRLRPLPAARRHLAFLGAAIFGLMAWGSWLEIPRMLLTPASVIFGASYADVHARIPFLYATTAVLAAGALLAIWHGFGNRRWPVPAAIVSYLVISVVGGVYAGLLQNFVVTPNEANREQPFIVDNIDATRRAYALDRVEDEELSGDAELKAQDIINNAATVENVRLWDHQPLLQTFSQLQEIRTYYDFKSVDNDRYMINGTYRQVMLSARELNTENLPTQSWVNERLRFTHGYGLTLGPVNQVTTEGLPYLFIKNLPPVSTVNLPVTEPSIYFGELSSSYVLVRTSTPEFHYPSGQDNIDTYYQGAGGVPVGGFIRRLLFALRFGTTDILVTNQITRESRIMFHRQINDRVRTIAPFLSFDPDPYPVVSEGRIFWIQDAYTTTGNYPYSTPSATTAGNINYIRNAIKIVIDAYNGTTTFYLAEPNDPIALTIANIFPGLLKPLAEMPADLAKHVRYPEEIFGMQAAIYATYHMTNPQVFYNKEDQWSVPVLDAAQGAMQMQPYYTIMKLPRERQPEFIQILPFTPRLKDNLSAWMVARSDGPRYGHMLVFRFPKQKIVYGPRQIIGRINQDQTISPQITLWDQQGSKVIWGTLLVIPIEESLLYVRPLYLQSPEGKIPELKRVIVAYQSQIVMKETLREALVEIFGRGIAAALSPDRLADEGPAPGTPGAPTVAVAAVAPAAPSGAAGAATLADLAAEAKAHNDRAMKALRDGDLALFGEEFKKLTDVIERMNKKK